jgi:hypothetical protein
MATTGTLSDNLYKLREQQRAHEEAIKQIAKERSFIEGELLKQMMAEGISKATGKFATVSIKEQDTYQVSDWDQFYEYIRKNKAFHLLERRPSVTGCREMFELKGRLPGVVPGSFKKINMTVIS